MTAGLWGQMSVTSANGTDVQELETEQAATVTSEPGPALSVGRAESGVTSPSSQTGKLLLPPGVRRQSTQPEPGVSTEQRAAMLLVPLSSSNSAEGFEGLVLSLINDSFF